MIDPVAVEMIENALVYAGEEMGIAVRNSAYSPNIKERLDHSCALFDGDGRLIAQAEHIPVHLGSLPWGLRRCCAIIERGVRRRCARATCGLPTIRISPARTSTTSRSLRPVFHRGALVGYAANKAHHADVGGARSRFDAGRRGRYVCGRARRAADAARRGRPLVDDDVRTCLPRTRGRRTRAAAILRAQVAGNYTGERRLLELCERYGATDSGAAPWIARSTTARRECARRCARSATAYSKPRIFSRIATGVPSLAHRACAWSCAMGAQDSTTRAPALRWTTPLNAVFGVTLSGASLRAARRDGSHDPDERRLLSAGRSFRSRGNAAQSAPSGAGLRRKRRDEHAQRRGRAAGAGAGPRRIRVPACSGGTMSNVMLGGTRRDGRSWAFYETNGCGMGARPDERRHRRDSMST